MKTSTFRTHDMLQGCRRCGMFLACATALLMVGCADAMLPQADLTDVNKLVSQHQGANAALKREAAEWSRSAEASAKERRWDHAAKMYAEAALRYPTFQALRGLGESTARSDRKRDTTAETLLAHKAAFVSAASTLRSALAFYERVPAQQISAADIQAVKEMSVCLESFVVGTAPACEPVKSVLQRYPVK